MIHKEAKQVYHDFGLTDFSSKEIYDKLKTTDLIKLLEKNLDMSSYADKGIVRQYFFNFVALNPHLLRYEEHGSKYYSKKDQIIYNILDLEYDRLAQASEQEVKQMQAELYLQSIKEIPHLRGMKKIPFDAEKLYNDVKQLLEENGWLAKQEK